MTLTGDLLGTLRYMSPEQAEGKSAILDHRTDIYSLGVTLYELLTLRPAFPAEDRQSLLKQIADQEPPAPRNLNKSLPVDLETIVVKAAAKEPDERYQSAGRLADDLRRFVGHQPIKARPPALAARMVKRVVKHRAAFATGFATLLVLLAITALVQWQARSEVEAKNQELQAAQRRTQHTLQLAREAVDDMYTEFAREWLSDQPRLTKTQQEFLGKAVRAYASLIQEFPDDRELKMKAALALILQSNQNLVEDSTNHGDNARRALALAESAAEPPLTLETAFGLARVRTFYFTVTKGQVSPAEAVARFAAAEAAAKSLESLVRQDSRNPDALEKLANVQGNLVTTNRGAPTAPQYVRRAVETAEKWVQLQPENEKALACLVYNLNLAWSYGQGPTSRAVEVAERLLPLRSSRENRTLLGQALIHHAYSDDVEKDIETSQRAMQIFERITEEFPDSEAGFSYLNGSYNRLMNLRALQGNIVAAAEINQKALDMIRRLSARMPSNPTYREQLLDKQCLHAVWMWLLHKPDESERLIEEASRADLAWVEKYGEATTLAQDVAKNYFITADYFIFFARQNPSAELRGRMMQGAIEFLERSTDDWECHATVFQIHPDDRQAETAFIAMQNDLRKRIADNPEGRLMVQMAGTQLKGPFRHLSDDREALELVQRAYELDGKDNPGRWYHYGWGLYRHNRFTEALTWFEKTKEKDVFKQLPYPAFGLALTQMKLGHREEANAAYKHGVEILRKKYVLFREEISVLREAAAAMGDEKIVEELLRDRWPGTEKARLARE